MVEYDIAKASHTDLKGTLSTFTVGAKTIDGSEYTYWDFPDAPENLAYYKTIPELKKAVDSLATWVVGKGVTTDTRTSVILENLSGMGEDSFQALMWNMIVQKKIFGAAFAEIIRDEGRLINLKPLYTGDMRVNVDGKGIIESYEQRPRRNGEDSKKFKTTDILHLSNDRIANEVHGTSVIEACKWVIDARNEVLRDHRKVIHRNVVPVRIIEIDTQNTAKRDAMIAQYESAIKKGEVLVLPKGTAEVKDTSITIQDPIQWIQYLENFFYQAVGIPRVIASAQDFSEASSKVGYLTFEPIYTREQTLLEDDLWNQLAIRVKFNRPPSLHGVVSQDEEKNTSQTGIQPNEVQASAGRTE